MTYMYIILIVYLQCHATIGTIVSAHEHEQHVMLNLLAWHLKSLAITCSRVQAEFGRHNCILLMLNLANGI